MIKMLSGNEAVARGMWEAGVGVASAYPGTPSTEILENYALFPNVYAEWAPNEKVALEVGLETALIRRGLDFDVGASGARLNYLQKQRTAIARALMKNADVLVFDEPTSGLDPATERAIVNGVLEWTRGKTVLWGLGRAELAQPFDRVLVFDRGKLAEDGTYDALASGGTLLPNMLK